ncbi:MAG: hypothetical protein R3C11_12845 [Planctomycetaceae bacterium]
MKRLFIVVVIILAVCAFIFGDWVEFSKDSDSASVTLNTKEVKEDTKAVFHKGEKALEEAADEVEQATDDAVNEDDAVNKDESVEVNP